MPDISKIQLPGSGGIYNIKDAVAREMISGGVSFSVAWDGTTVPDPFSIPAGVVVKYNNTNYTGILSADDSSVQAGTFYLVKSTTAIDSNDVYDEYIPVGPTGSRTWEKIGDTQVDLSNVVKTVNFNKNTDTVLGEGTTFTASDSNVNFSGGSTATVLGANTTFSNNSSSVTFSDGTTDTVLGENTTFTTTVTPATTFLGTTTTSDDFVTSVTAVAGNKLDVTEITGVSGTEQVSAVSKNVSKLETTTVPNITDNINIDVPNITGNTNVVVNRSTWKFEMGTGDASETLIIGGGNGTDLTATNTVLGEAVKASKITLTPTTVATGVISSNGTGDDVLSGLTIQPKTVAKANSEATTVATGTTSTTGTGSSIVTDVTVGSTAKALTSVGLMANTADASGRVQVATGITNASTNATTSGAGSDIVTAITNVGTGTAAAQRITVGSNDRHAVVKTIGTATAEAQTITVGDDDKINVLTDQTSITVIKGNQ